MTYDAGNRKDVRSKEKEAKLADANRLAYVKRIMSDTAGRKWMHDLLEGCHIWSTAFIAGHPDVTNFRLGVQNFGLSVFADVMAAAPDEYVTMMHEAHVKELVHERRYSDDRTTGTEYAGSEDGGRDVEASVTTEYDPFTPGTDPDRLN